MSTSPSVDGEGGVFPTSLFPSPILAWFARRLRFGVEFGVSVGVSRAIRLPSTVGVASNRVDRFAVGAKGDILFVDMAG